MLFGYPIAVTENNWLHDCIMAVLANVHALADTGQPYPPWPQIVPEAHRQAIRSRHGLRNRISAYDNVLRGLTQADRDTILAAMTDQNRIEDLLSGTSNCTPIGGLHEGVRGPVESLFDFAFELLSVFELRDRQYEGIYAAAIEHVCPFCGMEYFEAPGTRREDLDHYLAKSRYPFAAANLRNLVPMGSKCNAKYKLATDLLYSDDGTRRVAFDPYNHIAISVGLDESEPFGGTSAHIPRWAVAFDPESQAVQTWDEVFSVRERYRESHLDPDYLIWLDGFQKWARRENVRADSDEAIVEALGRYEQIWVDGGMKDRAFLKAAVFRMLRRHCENGHQRLMDMLKNLVEPLARVGP